MGSEPVARVVAARVRALRHARGWSAERLAAACVDAGYQSLTRSTIAKIESGVRKNITVEEIAGLANALGTTPTQLLTDESMPHVLWPNDERELLFELLRGVIFPDLMELYRQVAGVGAPGLPAETSYREVFLTLETLNAGSTGLPRPIEFIEHLASGRRSELSIELRRWADRQASRLGVIAELQEVRRQFTAPPPGPPPNSPAYLVMMLRRVGLTGERYQLANWSQLDLSEGWHPERGDDFFGTIGEIKHHVAVLIEDAETKWARYQPDIRIEFVLSGELLNLDVDQWPWEVEEGPLPPVPMGCRYPVAIRSLERMQAGKWHRSWHARWSVLTAQLDSGTIQPESSRLLSGDESIRTLVADFENNPDVVSVVLSKPPDPAQNGGTEVVVGLRAGVPLMVWSRDDRDSEEFLAAARELLHGDGPGVLQRVKQMRTTAYQSHPGHVGHHLALMWDDPDRIVIPAELGPPHEASVAWT